MADHHSSGSPAAPVRVVRLPQYTGADQDEILGPGDDPYGVADTGLTFLPKEIHFGVRSAGGRLVAHTGLLPLPLTVGSTDVPAVGVGGVAVAADRRGGGGGGGRRAGAPRSPPPARARNAGRGA
ncbi:GNAT family N-acetyltransferase, partial [Kitasatospora sp. NPDC093558]|uniref:GNAT family N-acetyltransferase n=1 Tax=Kitasatospora sp. NPDC093558 TaxID=3155201 RepID=UPI00341CE5F6